MHILASWHRYYYLHLSLYHISSNTTKVPSRVQCGRLNVKQQNVWSRVSMWPVCSCCKSMNDRISSLLCPCQPPVAGKHWGVQSCKLSTRCMLAQILASKKGKCAFKSIWNLGAPLNLDWTVHAWSHSMSFLFHVIQNLCSKRWSKSLHLSVQNYVLREELGAALNEWLIQLTWLLPVIKTSGGFEKGEVSEGEMVFRTQASSIDH